MVKNITNTTEFDQEIKGPGLVVVDYYADWCGPCRQISPFVESLSIKYTNVKFLKVNSDKSEISQQRGIRSLPTFQFFVNGTMVDEMKGANPTALEEKVVRYKVDVNPFAGQGFSLGVSPEQGLDFREARLRAFQQTGHGGHVASAAAAPPVGVHRAPAAAPAPETDDELALAIAMSMEEGATPEPPKATAAAAATLQREAAAAKEWAEAEAEQKLEDDQWGEEMVPVPVNEEILAQLAEMGFSEVQGRKAIVHGESLEGALTWLTAHQDDPDIDQPYMVRKADTMPKPVLTEEQKRQRVEEMKIKIAKRKEDKAKAEKEAEIRREKDRRERGQKTSQIQEERDRMMRKIEIDKQKREKMDAEKERARIKAEIARDKEVRRLNKGVLPGVLGVEGYNPSGIQYHMDVDPSSTQSTAVAPSQAAPTAKPQVAPAASRPAAPARTTASASASAPSHTDTKSPQEKIEFSIQTIMKYQTAGAGGHALKLLHTFAKNILENPMDPKYRSINSESNAYKTKIHPLVGPSIILKALGFQKSDEDGKWKLDGEVDLSLFAFCCEKLQQAEQLFVARN